MPEMNEAEILRIARKRVKFKNHFITYLAVNALLCVIWFMTGQGYFWPIWPMAGWGIGIFFDYIKAYHRESGFSVEREVDKIKREQGQS
jgi:2TM domain